jgi:hypothetical protein
MNAGAHSRIGMSTGRLLVLLAALGGLFAMHGMSDHGTAGPGELAASSAASPSFLPETAPVGEAVAHPDRHQDGNASPSGSGHGHELGKAGLCLAVLIAGLVIGVALWRREHRSPAAWLPRFHLGLAGYAARRVPKPPDLLALSIQRC